jgi:hypothetical protein
LLQKESCCIYHCSSCVVVFAVNDMDPTDLIPERRAKSWKREHEERCRRHQNNNDLKKCRDPGYGSDEAVLSDVKDSSAHFVKVADVAEKIETSAGDTFLNDDSIGEVESALTTTTGDCVIEYESKYQALVEGDVTNNFGMIDGILCDDSRNKGVLPSVQTTGLKTENNLLFQQCLEKDREDVSEINGLGVDIDRDTTRPECVCGDLSVCENVTEEEKNIILQQCETESPGNTAEKNPMIPADNEMGCSKLYEIRSDVLEVSAESSGPTGVKGAESMQLEEAWTVVEDTMKISHEVPQGVQSELSQIPEGEQTRPMYVKPDTVGVVVPRYLDILKDAPSEGGQQGLLGYSDLQGLAGDLKIDPECDMNNDESAQKPDVPLDTGENVGNPGETSDLLGSDAFKLRVSDLSQETLSNIRDVQTVNSLDSSYINSSSSDLEIIKQMPDEHVKGSVKSDDQTDSFGNGYSILSSAEAPGKVTEKVNEKEIDKDKERQNLFLELSAEETLLSPRKCVDDIKHSVCVVDSAKSLSPFEERKQYSCEFLESLDRSGQIDKHLTDGSFGNVDEYKIINNKYVSTEECDTGMNKLENSAMELSQANSKHLVDEAAVEMVGDTFHKYVQLESAPAGSEYCLAVDPVLDQTSLSETASLQPPAMADEDKVNFCCSLVMKFFACSGKGSYLCP